MSETSSISTSNSGDEVIVDMQPQEGQQPSQRWVKVRRKANELWTEFIDALSETNEQIAEQAPAEPEELNLNTLRVDICRCLSESHVYLETFAGIREFLIWRNPLASLCALCVIVYCIYFEFEFTIFLGLILFQLLINYLETQKKINIGLRFMPRRAILLPKFDFSGWKLALETARRVQMLVAICADFLEKLRALFMWRRPEVTFRFVLFISFFFCLSLITSFNMYIIIVAGLFVNELFVMGYLYHRFPRTRDMFSISWYFYRHTPTESKKKQAIAPEEPLTPPEPSTSKRMQFPFFFGGGALTRRSSTTSTGIKSVVKANGDTKQTKTSQKSLGSKKSKK